MTDCDLNGINVSILICQSLQTVAFRSAVQRCLTQEPCSKVRNYDKRAVSKGNGFIPYYITHCTLSSVCLIYTTFLEDRISALKPFVIIVPTNLKARSLYCQKRLLASSSLFVRPSTPTGRIFIKFHISAFFEKLSRKFKFIRIGEK